MRKKMPSVSLSGVFGVQRKQLSQSAAKRHKLKWPTLFCCICSHKQTHTHTYIHTYTHIYRYISTVTPTSWPFCLFLRFVHLRGKQIAGAATNWVSLWCPICSCQVCMCGCNSNTCICVGVPGFWDSLWNDFSSCLLAWCSVLPSVLAQKLRKTRCQVISSINHN